ncbi:MAG: hypothetical protein KDI92_05490 [Xanthomonadales bacterium]|nr:hypothetical protein [Xanthomonadales bacterium]
MKFYVVMDENYLIYQTIQNNNHSLWSMNLESKAKEKIFSSSIGGISKLIKNNGAFYFTAMNDSNKYNLWQTNGTLTSTHKISDIELERGSINVVSDQLFTINTASQLLLFKNNELIEQDVFNPMISNICVFNSEEYIVEVRNEQNMTNVFKRYKNGVLNDVYVYDSRNGYAADLIRFKNSCFYSYRDNESNERLFVTIPKSGEAELFETEAEIPTISKLFTHNDRLYAIAGDDYIFKSIYRFTDDLKDTDATVTINNHYSFSHLFSNRDLISAWITQNQYEPVSTILFFDADLNSIPTFISFSQSYSDIPHDIGTDVVLGFDDYREETVIQTINAENEVSLITIKNYGFNRVVTNGNEKYLYLSNDNSKTSNLYSLNDKPILNDLINGSWHEPDIGNQGLMVQKGRRHDGSEYIFVTLYTFDQGQPLWLAGVSDLIAEQTELEINLYQYNGLELFEYNATPNRKVFGQLKLEMETCDRLIMSINSDDYNKTFPLYRIDDSSYNHLCADIRTLTLDNKLSKNKYKEVIHE